MSTTATRFPEAPEHVCGTCAAERGEGPDRCPECSEVRKAATIARPVRAGQFFGWGEGTGHKRPR